MSILTLKSEQALLEQIQTMPQIGICFVDPVNKLSMQLFLDDPAFREILVEYQTQRLREVQQFTGQYDSEDEDKMAAMQNELRNLLLTPLSQRKA